MLRRIQLGNALAAFGSGFTMPFLFVYVARVRDLGNGTAGAVLAAFAAAALVVLPFAGRVIDRRGPMAMVVIGTGLAVTGALAFGVAGSAPTALLASALLGGGIAVLQPALATMIVRCSDSTTRSRAFATQFFLNNLGLGIGGLLGGLLVDEHRPASFTVLFTIEAAMFVTLLIVLRGVRMPGPELERAVRVPAGVERRAVRDEAPRELATGERPGSGWGVLFRDRPMVLLCVLGFVLFFTCYGQFESGLSAYAVDVTGISTSTLGVALAANTGVIVIAQFTMLRIVERRRRSRVVALVGLIWMVAWLAAGASGLVNAVPAMATALLIGTYALFGLGETMLSPTVAPLVADLAPARLMGQYNSAFALVKQLALAVGPAIGGLLAALGAYGLYIVLLVLCSLGISALALVLGRQLTAEQDSPLRGGVVARGGARDAPSAVSATGDESAEKAEVASAASEGAGSSRDTTEAVPVPVCVPAS
ncbi:MFS transporter [Streptomyces sp. AJS327]|uniref:MFS transporter n=1 Tax=Streptomyces sp. AJS327 TaxID=2545265 RepID=UPI0015DF4DDF|nr:MFS transporter [Streptomyces sp. AJS327]